MKKTIITSLVLGSVCAFAANQITQGADSIAASANKAVKSVKDSTQRLASKIHSSKKVATNDSSAAASTPDTTKSAAPASIQ